MRKNSVSRSESSQQILQQSRIAQADQQALNKSHRTRHSMAAFAAAGLLAISTPVLATFPAAISLADLDSRNGFVTKGSVRYGPVSFGRSTSTAGDINGDGIDDVIIGTEGSVNGGFTGKSYVVFGHPTGFPGFLDSANLNGSNGFVIYGIDKYDKSGKSVSTAGDINGDGIEDVIIGSGNEKSYVVFGRTSGFPSALGLSDLDGSNGFVINAFDVGKGYGHSVSAAGDINGDGISDVIIGARSADPNGIVSAGKSYVVYGRTTGFPAALNLSDLDGSNGFVINGDKVGGNSGLTISAAGDLNGDGIEDVIIGSIFAGIHVVFGRATGFPAILNLSDLDGSNGFVMDKYPSPIMSSSVSAAGDLNGDGIEDIIIGVASAWPGGQSIVVFGRTTGFPAAVNLSGLDGNNGFIINGMNAGDGFGHSVSTAGDFNGDGIDDVIIGAPFAVPGGLIRAGESYVVFGRKTGFPAVLNLSDIDGSNGFVINGIDAEDRSGGSVSTAGDFNGDGFNDIIVGAILASPHGNLRYGASYVLYGRDKTTHHTLPPSLQSLGDINADSNPDIAALVHDADASTVTAHVKDTSNGTTINNIKFHPDYSPTHFTSLTDINSNGAPELVVVGKHPVTGSVRAEIRDALSGQRLTEAYYSPDYLPKQLSIVPDMNANGADEMALLVEDTRKNRLKVVIKDGMTGAWLGAFAFNNNYQPQDMLVLPDQNGNGAAELAVLAIANTANQRDKIEIRDLKTGQLLINIFLDYLRPRQIERLSDQNGNGQPEIAIMMTYASKIEVRDSQTGNIINNVRDNNSYKQGIMTVVPDINGGGAEELAVLGFHVSSYDNKRAMIKDSQTAAFVSTVRFGANTSFHDLSVIDDINGNAASELVLLGTQDGKLRAIIKDAKTGRRIRSIQIP